MARQYGNLDFMNMLSGTKTNQTRSGNILSTIPYHGNLIARILITLNGNKIGIKPSEPVGKFLIKLNEASIVTRYPEELDKLQKDFTQPVVKDILLKSKEALEWIKTQF